MPREGVMTTITETGDQTIDLMASDTVTLESNAGSTGATTLVVPDGSVDTIIGSAASGPLAIDLGTNSSITFYGGLGYSTLVGASGSSLDLIGGPSEGLDEIILGGGSETVNSAGSSQEVALYATAGGEDSIDLGSGFSFVSIQGGQVNVDAGAGEDQFYVTASSAPSQVIITDFGAADSIAVFGTSSADEIVADGVVHDGDLTLTLAADNTVTLVGVTSLAGHFDDQGQGPVAVCYVAGTRILTERGEVAVELLTVGDRVVTASGPSRPVRWLGRRLVDCVRHPDPLTVWPIRIQAGAIAEEVPRRDLWISPGHSLFLDGALIPAGRLVNDATITQTPCDTVEYWHVELDEHDVILAEGLPAESYLDTGNRAAFFDNGGAYVEAHPDFRPKHWAETCAPLVTEGEVLQEVKTRLLDRAQVLGNRLTSDSEVHVVADAERIDPLFCSEERLAFVIPPFKSDIELRCRTFVPSSIDAASQDGRSLGLCVARLQLDGVDLPLSDQAAFEEGWHDLEVFPNQRHQRWSRGTAPLPSGTRLVVIEKAGRSYCWARQDQNADPQPTWAVLGGL